MRFKFPLFILFLFAVTVAFAQDQPNNASLDLWRGGYFRCCGLALATPTDWGIVEQPMQMATNHFVFKETDTTNIHGGILAARLVTDTTTLDSAGDVSDNISVLVPGVIACSGMICYGNMGMVGDPALSNAYSQGLPFTGMPLYLNFYMKINHVVSDTATYAYVFTKWNSISMKEDTLAINVQNIYDEDVDMNVWSSFTDTIHYLQAGTPDTLHLIFRGGVNGDPGKIGNTVWLDDISFYYPATGLVHLDKDDAFKVYPNPASNVLNIKADDNLRGSTFEIFDATGRLIRSMIIATSSFSIGLTNVEAGNYVYRVTDTQQAQTESGRFSILK